MKTSQKVGYMCLICGVRISSLRELKVSEDGNSLLCPSCASSGGKMISDSEIEDLHQYAAIRPRIFYEIREARQLKKIRPTDEARQIAHKIHSVLGKLE
ncbi:MAG: hypothetical protein WC375_07085 [Methanomassiliicoccales archaeon]